MRYAIFFIFSLPLNNYISKVGLVTGSVVSCASFSLSNGAMLTCMGGCSEEGAITASDSVFIDEYSSLILVSNSSYVSWWMVSAYNMSIKGAIYGEVCY